MLAILNRLREGDKQTLGHLSLFDGINKLTEVCILELADKDNAFQISRICAGYYNVVLRWSKKYGNHYHVLDVEGRTLILIHVGNYYYDTKGCILPGLTFSDINKDGLKDVTSSRSAMKRLLKQAPNGFKLLINDVVY